MNNNYIISSAQLAVASMAHTSSFSRFFLHTETNSFLKKGETYFFFEGYFLPRTAYMNEYSGLSGYDLLFNLFTKIGPSFVNYIKGFFSIVIIDRDNFYLYNDIHSVKRFFYYKDSTGYFISNSLDCLTRTISAKPFKGLAAHQALFQHYIGGMTSYEGVRYSEGATMLSLKNDKLSCENYWKAADMLTFETNLSEGDFNHIFREVVGDYINYFKPYNIASTITGGRDTRTVLAALLANGSTPYLFTFGNPKNRDVIVGEDIAGKLKLPFTNPNISNPEPSLYSNLIDKIIGIGNPFIHIHRAHRLHAIEQVNQEFVVDMLFVGAMGGDYIKGASFDDYIITEFVRVYFFERSLTIRDTIIKILDKHFVRFDDEIIFGIENMLGGRENFGDRDFTTVKEFGIVHDIVGCTHDIQDISVFSSCVDKVVAPYMDIDILEALFKTKYSLRMNSKNSSSLVNKFLGGELQAKLVMDLFPDLAKIDFANYYKPFDAAGGIFRYITRRGVAYLKQKRNPGVSGFEYGTWFHQLMKKELQELPGSLSDYYNIEKMRASLPSGEFETHEGYWHKYTNPITISRYM